MKNHYFFYSVDTTFEVIKTMDLNRTICEINMFKPIGLNPDATVLVFLTPVPVKKCCILVHSTTHNTH